MKFRMHRTGDTREIRKFTWYPVCIDKTIYWLEWITIRQSYNTRDRGWNNDWVITS